MRGGRGLWSPPPKRGVKAEQTHRALSAAQTATRGDRKLRARGWEETRTLARGQRGGRGSQCDAGLSKAHLQEWKGLKLQVETKCTLNT